MNTRLFARVLVALCSLASLIGVAGAADGPASPRKFAGFYEIGHISQSAGTIPDGDMGDSGESLRVMIHLRIFNFSGEDVTHGTLRVGSRSTDIMIAQRESLVLAIEMPAGIPELEAWSRGRPPRVSLTTRPGSEAHSVSLIPMRMAIDRAATGARRTPRPAAAGAVAGPLPAVVTTVAGGGPAHVPARTAALGLPYHLAIDSSGGLQIADLRKIRIFRVAPDGELTVTAGTGKGANLDINGDGGMAVDAIFGTFSGLAAGPDNELVSFESGYHFGPDETQGHVRRIDPVTGRIDSVLTGYPFSCPSFNPYMAGGVYDRTGSLLFIDQGCGYVWRIDSVTRQASIVAGDGRFGFSGDGGPATSASLLGPSSLAIDGAGNLYIGDAGNNRIRRVDAATGVISTVAGNGSAGDGGDGGPALEASLSVSALALDPAGNIHFTDTAANRVRRVDAATGRIGPSAGTGDFGFGGDGQPATAASFAFPFGIVSDAAGNLFISDVDNNRVRRIDAGTGIISTFSGGGTSPVGDGSPALDAELPTPARVAVSATDEMFIVTMGDERIRTVDPVTGILGTAARFTSPVDVATDHAGNLFVASAAAGGEPARVWRVDAITGAVSVVAGGGPGGEGVPAAQARLDRPSAIEVDDAGSLYIADQGVGGLSGRVLKVDGTTGLITTVAGGGAYDSGDGAPATQTWLDTPSGIALDATGNLYISEQQRRRVRRVDALTGIITRVAGSATGNIEGNTGDGGPASEASLANPADLVLDGLGNLYLATGTFQWNGQFTGRVRRIDASTGLIETIAEAIGPIMGLAADRRGNIYFADGENYKIRRVNLSGRRPAAVASAESVVECGAAIMLDGSNSSDADSTPGTRDDIVSFEWYEDYGTPSETPLGTGEALGVSLPRGLHVITLVVTDSQGERNADSVRIDVRDMLAPSITVDLNHSVLYPPNHRMVVVRASVSVIDQCGPATFTLKSITSNEPADARGKADGKTAKDIAGAATGTADTSFQLRAERSSSGTGRVYTIVYETVDAAGNTATMTTYVAVPLVRPVTTTLLSDPRTSPPGRRTGY